MTRKILIGLAILFTAGLLKECACDESFVQGYCGDSPYPWVME